MKSYFYLFVIVGLTLLATIEQVGAAPYAFSLDSISVTGQLDFIDEFSGNSLSSDWEITEGSVVVADGFATLTNPGTIFSDSINGVSYIQEDSFFQSSFSMQDGAGSFETTALWQEGAPELGGLFGLSIFDDPTPGDRLGVEISVANLDAKITDALGLPAGPGIIFTTMTDALVGTSIPSGTTGPIMLRLSFDDSSNLVTGSYNLGSGWVDFSPVSFLPGGTGNFQLGVDGASVEVIPIPASIWLFSTGLIGLFGVARKKVHV